jgi:hypothetical protein
VLKLIYLFVIMNTQEPDCTSQRITWLRMRGDLFAMSAEFGAADKVHALSELSAAVGELRACKGAQ